MKSKFFKVVILSLVATILFSSCGQKGTHPSTQNNGTTVTEGSESSKPELSTYRSALTGLPVESEEASMRRPVAIMINNIKKALPQYGISNASIVFEALAEGGITRLLAVFDDIEDVEQIGTVRSARPYYIDFAESIDAVYIHIGGSPEAYQRIKNDKIDAYDMIEGKNNAMYWRDKDRIKSSGYEHSVFTSGARIMEKLREDGVRMVRDDAYGPVFNFSEDAEYEGRDATDISAVFSSYKTGTYKYDESLGLYRIGQYGTSHTDALSGGQLAFKNIFILRMNSSVIPGDTAGRLRFDSVGSGSGYYFVNGTKTDITWERSGKASPFRFHTADGASLEVVPGDSYVAIVPLNADVTIKGE